MSRSPASLLRCLAVLLLVAPATALAAPAHAAATACTLNGVAQPGPDVVGTSADDTIVCSSLDAGHTVEGLGGVDTITLAGTIDGNVRGGDGGDRITLAGGSASVGPMGSIDGQFGDDDIEIGAPVLGAVRGGRHNDTIHFVNGSSMASRTLVRGARGSDTLTFDDEEGEGSSA
ncbi:hypothetical protein ACLF6K_00045 [Streptomyces xanthophaeus]|uniref:hypothetical protein n=1 Tax=Streptomyces xanthophaeus TaxID=67385 RepID=UPI00398F91BF